jgi:hypothetical protein
MSSVSFGDYDIPIHLIKKIHSDKNQFIMVITYTDEKTKTEKTISRKFENLEETEHEMKMVKDFIEEELGLTKVKQAAEQEEKDDEEEE